MEYHDEGRSAVVRQLNKRFRNSLILLLLAGLSFTLTRLSPAQASATQPFSVSISAPNSSVKVGDPLEVDVSLTNTSGATENFEIERYDEALGYLVSVVDSAGKRPPFTAAFKASSGLSSSFYETVAPAGVFESSIFIDEIYDLKLPGKYTVQVWKGIPSDMDKSARAANSGYVLSNTITMAVTSN